MTTAVELRARMNARWHGFNPDRNWNGLCDALKGWIHWLATGVEPTWYPTAFASWEASPAASGSTGGSNFDDAPLGAILWWDVGSDDHVAVKISDTDMLQAYKDCDEFWGNNYGTANFHNFQARHGWRFRGWTYVFGPYFKIPIEAPAPPALQPHERRVASDTTANRRTLPLVRDDTLLSGQGLPPNETGEMKGYVRAPFAESVNGSDIWFVGLYSGNYFHSSSFVGGADTTGLTDITPSTPIQPPVTPPIVWPEYEFTAFSEVVTEVIPAHPSNFMLGNFPASPTTLVLHDFGTKKLNTYGSVINYFTGDHTTDESKQVSSHFVVSGNKIVQMVALKDRAFHAGPGGNSFIGIEIDPEVSSDSDFGRETVESVRRLIRALRDHYAKDFVLLKHPEVPGNATSCGDDINKALYVVEPYVPVIIDDQDPQPDPDDPDVPSDPKDPIDPDTPLEPDPEEPPVTKPPVLQPNPEEFENAVVVVTTEIAKWLPKAVRDKIYAWITVIGGIATSLGLAALAIAPAVGGEAGGYIATVGAVVTLIGSLAGTSGAILARKNLSDPVTVTTTTATPAGVEVAKVKVDASSIVE